MSRFGIKLEPFLARRLPPAREQTLSHKGIFILPGTFGLVWLLLVALLFLLATNYQNNLILGIALLMSSLFVTCILYSYRNLEGLSLQRLTLPTVYAGSTLPVPVRLSAKRDVHQLSLEFAAMPPCSAAVTPGPTDVLIAVTAPKRGLFNPGRLKVQSSYPLGLMRTWTWVDLDICHPVFASPIEAPLPLVRLDEDKAQHDLGAWIPGVDEYQGLKSYIPGESLKQVAWKQLAQGRGMLSKDFAEPQGAPRWLSLPSDSVSEREHGLSVLSFWVDELSARQQIFGLILPGLKIAPSLGEAHRIECQIAIACVGAPPELIQRFSARR